MSQRQGAGLHSAPSTRSRHDRTGRRALVQGRDHAIELTRQEAGRANRGTDIDRRACIRVGGRTLAVLEERILAREGAGDLVAQLRCGGRARANDLVFRQRLVEAGKRLPFAAGEADPAVALGVGSI